MSLSSVLFDVGAIDRIVYYYTKNTILKQRSDLDGWYM